MILVLVFLTRSSPQPPLETKERLLELKAEDSVAA